jgi:hypothetical protein
MDVAPAKVLTFRMYKGSASFQLAMCSSMHPGRKAPEVERIFLINYPDNGNAGVAANNVSFT